MSTTRLDRTSRRTTAANEGGEGRQLRDSVIAQLLNWAIHTITWFSTLTEDALLKRIEQEIEKVGSAKTWALRIGVQESQLSLVRKKKIAPPPLLLAALGLRRIVSYVEDE